MGRRLECKNAGSRHRSWVRLLAALAVAFAAWLALPGVTRADWSVVGDTVPSGQVIDNDVLASGTNVVIDGTINGDLLAIGSTVTVNGPVSGSLVAAGETVILNGKVGGSTYVGGRTLTLGGTSDVVHNVHFAGLRLDGQRGSRIGRDLVVAGVRGRISGQVGRAISGFILVMTLNGQIGSSSGALTLEASPAGLGDGLLGVALRPGEGLGFGYAGRYLKLLTAGLAQQGGSGSAGGIPGWLMARLTDLLILVLLGGLVVWLRPAVVRRPAEWLGRRPLPAAGFGVLAVLLAVNEVAVAILLAVLLLIGGIWLGVVTLWTLAFVLWGIGFPVLILGLALLALTVMYGSKVIVAYLVGTLILKRLAPKVMEYRILPLLLGLVLYVILRAIPILGWVIEGIVTILGLGAIWLALRRRRSVPQALGMGDQAAPALALEK